MSVEEELKEQAEHAKEPFDRNVALTMAVIAAVMAIVSVAGQILVTEELLNQQKASDQWAFYQAKDIRRYESDIARDMMAALSAGPAAINKYAANMERYDKDRGDIQAEARKLEEESHVHGAQALRAHLGEVFLEIAIVLASLAILTKRRPMWYRLDAQRGGGRGYRCHGSAGALAGVVDHCLAGRDSLRDNKEGRFGPMANRISETLRYFSTAGVCLALALAGASTARALDPNKKLTQYVHRTWQTPEGLSQTSVYSVTQTRDGYLWIGTQSGVLRFDGVEFNPVRALQSNSLGDVWARSMMEDGGGRLWILTNDFQLIRITGSKVKVFSEEDGLPTQYFSCLVRGCGRRRVGLHSYRIGALRGRQIRGTRVPRPNRQASGYRMPRQRRKDLDRGRRFVDDLGWLAIFAGCAQIPAATRKCGHCSAPRMKFGSEPGRA